MNVNSYPQMLLFKKDNFIPPYYSGFAQVKTKS